MKCFDKGPTQLRYFDRAGNRVSREQWKQLLADMNMSGEIARGTVNGVDVTTMWHGVDQARRDADPPMNYYVVVDDRIEQPQIVGHYASESAALAAHTEALERLASGQPLLFENERAPSRALMSEEAGKAADAREFRALAFRGLVAVLAQNWHTIVTPGVAASSRPVAIVDHQLIVEVDRDTSFSARDMSAALDALGREVISRVALRVVENHTIGGLRKL